MISVAQAIKIVERETISIGTARVELRAAVGRVLAVDIVADTDLPPFDRSQMDGYAVIAADTLSAPASLKIIGESAAGNGWRGTVTRGKAVRIMTGAPVPAGADSVLRLELARETEGSVTILEPVGKGTSIVPRGAEIKLGTPVLRSGEVITPNMIAVLASFGYAKVRVGKSPRVSILGTGSEIVEITRKPGRDQIRNSNSAMLDVLSRGSAAETAILPIVRDDIDDLKRVIGAAAKTSDILLITGGVSVGKYDHTKTALTDLGAEIFFERLRLKPGKPTVFAKLGKMLIFGLPGNPVSAATAFHLLVRSAIRRSQGAKEASLDRGTGIASDHISGTKERDNYVPCRMSFLPTGEVEVRPMKSQGSSDFITFARADCMAIVPRRTNIETGARVNFVVLPKC